MNPLIELKEFGQSIWYDNIRRSLITSGEFRRMVEEYGVTGVTSNPVIFEKAVSGGTEYDEHIKRLIREGRSDREILDALTTEDVRLASEVLEPAYKAGGGTDGYVSIEVSPHLAYDAKATIEEARHLYTLAGRPNVMVKVPATLEGVEATEELLYEGYNINVTLLFSVKRYEEVARAYIRALERRAAEGKPVNSIFSVASFFVSRVDTIFDRALEEMAERAASHDERARLKALVGKVAVANSKLAYEKHTEIFGSKGFEALKGRGAREQRLLWASTSTKDPRYSDVKYVTELIGKNTINTMPLQTMTAFHDHGRVAPAIEEGLDEAKGVMAELALLGVDYDRLTSILEEEGVRAFAEGYDSLTRCISGKRELVLKGEAPGVELSLGGYEDAFTDALRALESGRFSTRLWEKDPTLWKKAAAEAKLIKGMLGWLALPATMQTHAEAIKSFATGVKGAGFRDAVLLGMGGSSLAPLVLAETFRPVKGYPRLTVLDTTDPDSVKEVSGRVDPARTLFIVSSKSGSTIEPLSLFEYFYAIVKKALKEKAGGSFIAITDPGTALEGFSRKYSFRHLFTNPPDIGGRFSALSFFGLVPAAVTGIDISRLLYHAQRVEESAQPCVAIGDNPSVKLGAALGALAMAGRDKATFFISKEVSAFGLWIEQLLAESTGKEGRGIVPVTGEPAGSVRSYGDDRAFVHIGVGEPDKKTGALLDSLSKAGHPVVRIRLKDPYELGGEFFRWEVATAAAGAVLGINPFDQPDVELSKRLTMARLNKRARSKKPPGVEVKGKGLSIYFGKSSFKAMKEKKNTKDLKGAVSKFLGLAGEGDYIGVLAYHNIFDKAFERPLRGLKKALRDSTGAAIQSGFGPRYLHSTGQLHKGGPGKGVFLILAHCARKEIKIPGSPFGFSELELSQAYGDMEALDSKGVRVALISLGDSKASTLERAVKLIKGALK